VPTNRVTQILNGTRTITGDSALRLAHFFGTSAQLWLNLQSLYDLRIAQEKLGKSIKALPTLQTTPSRPRTNASQAVLDPDLSDARSQGAVRGQKKQKAKSRNVSSGSSPKLAARELVQSNRDLSAGLRGTAGHRELFFQFRGGDGHRGIARASADLGQEVLIAHMADHQPGGRVSRTIPLGLRVRGFHGVAGPADDQALVSGRDFVGAGRQLRLSDLEGKRHVGGDDRLSEGAGGIEQRDIPTSDKVPIRLRFITSSLGAPLQWNPN
jgi:hypothetical protein